MGGMPVFFSLPPFLRAGRARGKLEAIVRPIFLFFLLAFTSRLSPNFSVPTVSFSVLILKLVLVVSGGRDQYFEN